MHVALLQVNWPEMQIPRKKRGRLRRNPDAGWSESAQADKIKRVEPPEAAEPKKKDRTDEIFSVLLLGPSSGIRTHGLLSPKGRQDRNAVLLVPLRAIQ